MGTTLGTEQELFNCQNFPRNKVVYKIIFSCSRDGTSTNFKDYTKPLKEISMPFPPIPATKHWNPDDSRSATTLSTTDPDNTVFSSQRNRYLHKKLTETKHDFIKQICKS